MQKRIVSLLLALCLVCGVMSTVGPAAWAQEEEIKGLCGVGLRYVINPNTRTLTISGTGELGASAPWQNHSDLIDKVIIEPGVTAIGGERMFQDMRFTEAVLPDGLTEIGEMAFTDCTKMTKCDIPASVTTIGTWAFKGCSSLAEVKFPSGMTEIASHSFWDCKSLTTLDIPSSIKRIGEWAFRSCGNLKEVTLHEGLESIGGEAFLGTALERVVVPASVTSMGSGVFYECGKLKTAVMLGGGKTLPAETFIYCGALEHIKLQDNLETVEYNSFKGCDSLTRLDFPMSVTSITTPFTTFNQTYPNLKIVVIPNPECVMGSERWDGSLGMPGTTTLYTTSPSIIEYAIERGYDVQDPGNEPEDDWDPFAEPEPPKKPSNVTVNVTGDYFVGGSIQITASAQDAESITVIVEHNGEVALSKDVGPAVYVFPEAGTYEVYARATNGNGSVECERQTLIVRTPEPTDTPSPSPSPDVPTDEPTPTPGNPTPEPANQFKDVPATHYARKAINWAVTKKVVSGMTVNTFGVGKKCDRSQAVFFIWAAEGRPEPTLAQNPFTDVKSGAYYYKAVLWAKENNITGGKTATTFDPTGDVTRGQIMTFLYAAQGRPSVSGSKTFSDVKSSDYYSKAVAWAAENGISSGKGAGTFKPRDNCKREEIVTFLYQAYK